ncbi:MAG TPA: glycogen synthase GlgA, partial [Luteitalea sp.]|nr:glycogen synthase GlgA [Luteitalea sp.]
APAPTRRKADTAAPPAAAVPRPVARKTAPKKTAAPADRVPGETVKTAPVRKAAAPRVRKKAAPPAEVVHGVAPEEAAQAGVIDADGAVASPLPDVAASEPAGVPAPAATVATAPAVSQPVASETDSDVDDVRPPRPESPVDTGAAVPHVLGNHDRPLRILMVASEAVPFAKTGGLADVAAALPKALGALGHDVTVVMPRYRGIAVSGAPATSYAVAMGGHHYKADVHVRQTSPGVRVALVDHPAFFDRDALYGLGSHDYADNPRRFAFLALAALEFARLEGRPVDIVHAHDWQGGLAPVYLKTRYASDPVIGGASTIFTIHNIAYQGLCAADWLPQLGLPWDVFTTDGLEFWLHASFLKAGIMFSDLVTTVSPRYAQELMTPEFAFGFEGILRHRAADMVGILNGIDDDVWNPGDDRHLPRPYSADDLAGKADAKRVLLDTYGLPGGDDMAQRPVIAMISRMVDQKGLDLIASVSEQLPHLGAAFVILGTGEPWYEEMWRSLSRRYPDRVGVRIGFDEPLSHVIEAGADLFMMPSRFEPCGLNQMYSLRYGTLPVVRATGGLDDTVQNYDPASGVGTGFKFHDASGEALLGTLRWALHVFHNDPDRWRQLQRAGMGMDFSWQASARAYLEAYKRARTQVSGRQGGVASA